MHTRRILPVMVVVSAALLIGSNPAPADVVIMKDGFTLHGKVRRQMTSFVDPVSGQQVEMAKLNSFFAVDDEARRIIFSMRQVQDVDERDVSRETDPLRFALRLVRIDNSRLPAYAQFQEVTPWDTRWERVFNMSNSNGRVQIPQRITLMTPHFVRVDSLRYAWTSFYLTRELGPDMAKKLLSNHPELKLNGDAADPGRRFRVARFLIQAGWYEQADEELKGILKDLPGEKEKVESLQESLRKIRAMQAFDEIERGQKAGRHQWVQTALAQLPQEGLDEKQATRLSTLKAEFDKAASGVMLARRLLKELPSSLENSPARILLADAAAAIAAELHADAVGRLESFISFAQLAERARDGSRTPEHAPDQLLSLAISGWLLGNGSAEAKVDTAERLWRTRQFVLEYQRTHETLARQHLLAEYQKAGAVAGDEMEQLIRSLPPPEPANPAILPSAKGVEGGLGIVKLQADLPGARRRNIEYYVQLPPEYHHGRGAPVLFVLHGMGEKARDILARWRNLAALHGYILVAPEWQVGVRETYEFTADEHAAVLDVLRDLRRQFQVDSDRVFLFGWGEGANMAFDVGLSHPDQFAGIIPMCCRARYFMRSYWRNGQYLPYYVVDGDLDGDNARDNRRQFEQWVPRGYPALYAEYKGRGMEWFEAELPYIVDWMSRKKRATAFPELGKSGNGGPFGEEFQTMRTTDNRFYWVTVEGLGDRYLNQAARWDQKIVPAAIQGRISEGNQITLIARGFKKVTVWLSPGMIDFTKSVSVTVNAQSRWSNRMVVPSLSTLLEEFYQNGDRQRLFLAKMEINLTPGN